MKVVICPDSFKGSIEAPSAAEAVRGGVESIRSDIECVCLPIADGGEGSVSVIRDALGAEWIYADVTGPYGERVRAKYAMRGNDAYIEMAEASGLCLSNRKEPMEATTRGTGELMIDAVKHGAERITVFIGGSATCDGGIGMAEAFGYRFSDKDGRALSCIGKSMTQIAKITPPNSHPLSKIKVICASDVTNPTYGESGAAFVFAPQKGADEQEVLELDRGLRTLADVVCDDLGIDVHTLPGGGAAGGLGAGLYAFASAEMKGGFSVIADILGLEEHISRADAVITGEGCTDLQSVMGKVVGSIAHIADKHSKKCIVISGLVKDTDKLAEMGIYRSYSCVNYAPSVEDSINDAAKYITLAARDCAREL